MWKLIFKLPWCNEIVIKFYQMISYTYPSFATQSYHSNSVLNSVCLDYHNGLLVGLYASSRQALPLMLDPVAVILA